MCIYDVPDNSLYVFYNYSFATRIAAFDAVCVFKVFLKTVNICSIVIAL